MDYDEVQRPDGEVSFTPIQKPDYVAPGTTFGSVAIVVGVASLFLPLPLEFVGCFLSGILATVAHLRGAATLSLISFLITIMSAVFVVIRLLQ